MLTTVEVTAEAEATVEAREELVLTVVLALVAMRAAHRERVLIAAPQREPVMPGALPAL